MLGDSRCGVYFQLQDILITVFTVRRSLLTNLSTKQAQGEVFVFAHKGASFLWENFQLIHIKKEQDTRPMRHCWNNKQKMTRTKKVLLKYILQREKKPCMINYKPILSESFFFLVCVQQNERLEAKVPLHAQESDTIISP